MHSVHPTPKFSIITVTYNAEKVLEDTIQSVISQTYHHVEYIIVDGASKDGTLSECGRLLSRRRYFATDSAQHQWQRTSRRYLRGNRDCR